jgi:putative ABC transport system substrate-binding protein
MRRRNFLGTLAATLLTARVESFAQAPSRTWRIGFLSAGSRELLTASGSYPAFLDAMRAAGYVEGRNLVIEWREAGGDYGKLPLLAQELVRLKVDLIVAVPSPAIRAAKEATTVIPIVFPSTGDPVGNGFAASLAHPGGNLTGISNSNLDITAKLLDLLKTIAPKITRVAVLSNPGSSTAAAITASVRAAASSMGLQIVPIAANNEEQIATAFATIRRERADALVVAADAFLVNQSPRIAALALANRLPSISQSYPYSSSGGLMTYGHDLRDNYRRCAVYVDKILRGAKPGDLPIEQPTTFSLIVNEKTARELGLAIPQSITMRADKVIH